MTTKQIDIVYRALRRNDGYTICPDWPKDQREELTLALDVLRLELLDRIEKP